MFGKRRGVEVLGQRQIKLGLVEMEQALVAVPQGLGRLRLVWSHLDKQPPPYEEYLYQLRLGDVPLAQLLTSGCPTCASMLAAGYGLAMDDRKMCIRDRVQRGTAGGSFHLRRCLSGRGYP